MDALRTAHFGRRTECLRAKFGIALIVGTAAGLATGGLACGGGAAEATDAGTEFTTSAEAEGCASCHLPEYQSARGHVGKKPTTCATCHTQSAWHPTKPRK